MQVAAYLPLFPFLFMVEICAAKRRWDEHARMRSAAPSPEDFFLSRFCRLTKGDVLLVLSTAQWDAQGIYPPDLQSRMQTNFSRNPYSGPRHASMDEEPRATRVVMLNLMSTRVWSEAASSITWRATKCCAACTPCRRQKQSSTCIILCPWNPSLFFFFNPQASAIISDCMREEMTTVGQ